MVALPATCNDDRCGFAFRAFARQLMQTHFSNSRNADDTVTVAREINSLMGRVTRPPGFGFPAPYLVVSAGENYGGNLFVWDHYHMSLRFAAAGRPEFLRYLCDNVFHHQEPDGFTPNCILHGRGPRGSSSRFHAQPFLARAAAGYLKATGDQAWATEVLPKITAYLDYYDRAHGSPLGLHRWAWPFHSGIDNDVVTTFHLPDSVVPADLSSFLVLEHRALAYLADAIGASGVDAERADALSELIRQHLWSEDKSSFAAFDLLSGKHLFAIGGWKPGQANGAYAYQSCSNLIPLYAGVATADQAAAMIPRYVLSADHFWSDFGIRSLSRSSEFYNNAIWGNPPRYGDHTRPTNSNWQGPIWFPLSFFVHRALRKYGFPEEADDLRARTLRVLALSVESVGSFAENFCGETGKPLYARDFAAWNLLADVMHDDLPWEFF